MEESDVCPTLFTRPVIPVEDVSTECFDVKHDVMFSSMELADWLTIHNFSHVPNTDLSVIFSILRSEFDVTHYVSQHGTVVITKVKTNSYNVQWVEEYLNRLLFLLAIFMRKLPPPGIKWRFE